MQPLIVHKYCIRTYISVLQYITLIHLLVYHIIHLLLYIYSYLYITYIHICASLTSLSFNNPQHS